jgi:hypothetical protein
VVRFAASAREGRIQVKRIALAVLVGIIVFATVYGFAASLAVGSQTLGAGTSTVAACQSTTLTASYAVTYDSTIPAYKVGVVTVNGLDTTAGHCASKAFRVTLTGPGASNASLGEITGTTPAAGASFTADFTPSNVAASSVTGLHVVISG